MKIEKINDNQIKCTLNKSDLASRQIKLSELAYGTEKAKNLFRDMMQQASHEFGFEADDIPLMIEAIPVSSDCIVLVITKVDDPEELDTRFSKFAPSMDEIDIEDIEGEELDIPSTSDLLDMFNHVRNELKSAIERGEEAFIPLSQTLSAKKTEKDEKKPAPKEKQPNIKKIFTFDDLDLIINVSKIVCELYNGVNSLYKSADDVYYLVISKSNASAENFNKVCNILSEYGDIYKGSDANEAFFKEHYKKIIKGKALQKLQTIN